MKKTIWGLTAGGAVVVLAAGVGFALAQPILPPPQRLSSAQAFRHLGPASCTYCHGRTSGVGAWSGEHSTWVNGDPHARAFSVLLNQEAKLIEKNLNKGLSHIEDAFPEKNPVCLNCHVQPNVAQANLHDRDLYRGEGVSCESCHGPAEKYIGEHYKASWKRLTWPEKTALGMKDTRTLAGRTRLCVDCHVGQPGSDVNHDLIAAGHPWLKFEFSAFHADYKNRHWVDAKDPRGSKDFSLRAWETGQFASAEAALHLLAERAGNPKLPWPEFAEYDCFACHHDLKANSAHQQRYLEQAGTKRFNPGELVWGDWYLSVPKVLAERAPQRHQQLLEELAELKGEMAKGRPDRNQVKTKAQTLARQFAGLSAKLPTKYEAADLPTILTWLEEHQGLTRSSWDAAAQYALALAALDRAGRDAALGANFAAKVKDARRALPSLDVQLLPDNLFPAALRPRLTFPAPRTNKD